MLNYNEKELVNIGTGKDITIKELAETVKEIVGFKGELKFNTDMPDGTPRKLLDVTKLNAAGWKYKIELKEGIKDAYKDFMKRFY